MSSEPLYPNYLPTRPDGYATPTALPPFAGDEPGLRADPAKPSLLAKGASVSRITPRIGTEIRGVQISQLGKEGLDEIALLAAERGVVVFVRNGVLLPPVLKLTKPCVERSRFRRCWVRSPAGDRQALRTAPSPSYHGVPRGDRP